MPVRARRRASDTGIETAIGCHSFRATGIAGYLRNGGRVEIAQRMAGHPNAKTTGLYDRRNDGVSLDEVGGSGLILQAAFRVVQMTKIVNLCYWLHFASRETRRVLYSYGMSTSV